MIEPWWAKYVGIPYLDRGRDARQGLDCWGLVRWVYLQEQGLALPSLHEHDGHESIRALLRRHVVDFVKLEGPQPFAIPLISSTITVMHVGVLIDERRMLHTVQGRDACIELVHPYRHKLQGYYLPLAAHQPLGAETLGDAA